MQEFISTTIQNISSAPLTTGLVVLTLLLFVSVILLTLRLNQLTRGSDGKTLEGTITSLVGRVDALESYARKNQQAVKNIDGRVTRAIQGVSVKRFDPFQQQGGQQSFSTALLNEKGDGVVISGIHARDQVRIYAKDVTNFTSERELSEEEARAISEVKNDLAGK